MSFELYQVPIDHLSADQLDTVLRSWVRGGHGQKMVVTPNAEMLLRARQDEAFLQLLQQADLCLPDTVSLQYAVAALYDDRRLQFRHTGVDTLWRLAQICEDQGRRLALFGGREGVSRESASVLRQRYPELDVVGINPGDIIEGQGRLAVEDHVLRELHQLGPTVIAVALGAGKQETFMKQFLPQVPSVRVAIGVGGALDMLSGRLRRAPKTMQRTGFEWLWRLGQEPRRVKRITQAAVVFPTVVAMESFQRGRFTRALKNVLPEVRSQLTNTRE